MTARLAAAEAALAASAAEAAELRAALATSEARAIGLQVLLFGHSRLSVQLR